MYKKYKNDAMYKYLIILVVAATAGLQGWRTLFNNFAVDNIGISGVQVGIVQSVREIPGFLSLLVIFVLLFIKEHKLSAFSIIIMGVGVFMTGLWPSYTGLIVTTFIMSLGFHYFETTNKSLTLQYFNKTESPLIFARQKSLSSVANIAVGIFVWFLDYILPIEYNYLVIGTLILLAGIYCMYQNPIEKEIPVQNKKMVLKKEYWLFYILNLLSGARRQIFVVFAVFMLVQKYEFSVKEVTALFIINNIIGYFVSPLIGKAINKFGEKIVLSVEYIAIFLIFAGYAFIENRTAVAGLYILDHIFFGCSMGISTFFQKMAKKEDIAPSMAVGFTINHISAVVIPTIGGLLWMLNWRVPFIFGMFLSIISLFFTQKIKGLSK
ncbi:MAG: MFS transporter [Marinifilaceae bacterium]